MTRNVYFSIYDVWRINYYCMTVVVEPLYYLCFYYCLFWLLRESFSFTIDFYRYLCEEHNYLPYFFYIYWDNDIRSD